MSVVQVVSKKLSGAGQEGIALVLTLTILLILTVLGVSSVQTTSMQERMARNYRDTNIAFQGAEAAVKEAEEFLETMPNIDTFPEEGAAALCVSGLCNSLEGVAKWSQSYGYVDWDSSSTYRSTSVTKEELGSAVDPKYLIEYVAKVTIEQDTLNIGNVGEGGSSGRAYIFRITSRGSGGTEEAAAMIQTLYGLQF